MKRRGFIKQHRNGKWGYDLRIVDPATGRRTKRVRVYEFETRREAELAAAVWGHAVNHLSFGIKHLRTENLRILRLPGGSWA